MRIIGAWTYNGIPKIGLTPLIKISDADTDMLIIDNKDSIEYTSMPGVYYYDFIGYDKNKNYIIRMDSVITEIDSRYTFASNKKIEIDDDASNIITDSIWDVLRVDHNTPGTMGALLNFIVSIEGGKWEIKNDQMIFYMEDNVTEIARFNLYSNSGNPTMINPSRRDRV